jgi:catechol 2,3-dioxygenase-like lactoylglutathione lyase family enzyme
MSIRRVVPDISAADFALSREFYVGFLGFEVGMEMGFVMTFVSPTNPTAQVTVFRGDDASTPQPNMTIEVADVDAVHAKAIEHGIEIMYPLTDEPWGVRRFFVSDPNGMVINVMSHH